MCLMVESLYNINRNCGWVGDKSDKAALYRANVQCNCEHIKLNTGVCMGDTNGKKVHHVLFRAVNFI